MPFDLNQDNYCHLAQCLCNGKWAENKYLVSVFEKVFHRELNLKEELILIDLKEVYCQFH